MTDDASRYLDEHARLLRGVAVSDRDGGALSFDEGVQAINGCVDRCRDGDGTVWFVGNGGSAAIASHFAIDFWNAGDVRAGTFLDGAMVTCMANDHGYEDVYARPIERHAKPEDLLVAISSSGRSENILRATDAARDKKLPVITLSGFDSDNPLRTRGDCNLYVAAHHYGFVECIHMTLLHCVLDVRMGRLTNPAD
jgi:D-sedoheptulose 7-phosphate isomerase